MHARWLERVKKYMPAFDVADLPQTYVKGFDYANKKQRRQVSANLKDTDKR